MTTAPLPNAGVRFPPPLIYLLGLALGYGLNRVVPLWIASPEPRWMFRLGIVLGIAGFLFAVWGILTFRRRGTAIIPFHPATTIVTTGPYRFTRNPMYIGMSVFYTGVALLLDTWWAFALLPVVVTIIERQVIAREERYLASAFGAEYDAYRSRVRRCI
jgi:protein-S-isoprenylcysteine O-methyltransferase Ste14